MTQKKEGFQHDKTARSWIRHIEQSIDVFRNQALYPFTTAWFQRHPLAPEQKVLDVCCGQSASTCLAGEAYPNNVIIGIDYSHTLIARARELNMHRPKLSFYEASAGQIPFPSGYFDLIMCLNGIFHLSPQTLSKFFMEVRRMSKPGAPILITSVNPEAYKDFAEAFTKQRQYSMPARVSHMPERTSWIIGKPQVAGPKGKKITLGDTPFYKHSWKNIEYALQNADLSFAEPPKTLASLQLVGGPNRDLFVAYTLQHT